MAKVDSIIAENPDLTLDDLVTTRKINNDQKAQAQKKPALLQQLQQAEEQLSLYKNIGDWYDRKLQDRLHSQPQVQTQTEKPSFDAESAEQREKLESRISYLESRLKQKDEETAATLFSFKPRLLTLSRFLRAAAARRQNDADEDDVKTQAFEGVLLALYGGDSNAVFTAEKLINGSSDHVSAPDGTVLDLTCKSSPSYFILTAS